jgi:ABC-type nitrate/sulfonate/bicarbonate transport system substrate-binding protein
MHRIVVRNDSGIKQPRDLEGKRVADQMGSSTHGGLLLYCKKNLVDPAKIKFVSLSPRDFPEAMIAEQVDAIVGSEPWPGNVMSKCKDCTEFANLKDLGNSYPLPIIARSSFLTEHPEAARAIVAGTRRAVELIKSDPGRAAQVIANVSGLPVEREQKAMADYDWSVELDEAVLESLKLTAQFLKEQKKIEAVPDLVGLLDRSGFAPAAGN